MPNFSIRLIEELILQDSAEFCIDAPTPGEAAALLIEAHSAARLRNSNIVSLPDGQEHCIDPENAVDNRVYCILLDENGAEIREIEPISGAEQSPPGHNNPVETTP